MQIHMSFEFKENILYLEQKKSKKVANKLQSGKFCIKNKIKLLVHSFAYNHKTNKKLKTK